VTDLSQLTLLQRASLGSGVGMWSTQSIPEAGIDAVSFSDGPHGLRRQPTGEPLSGGESIPATCWPPAAAVGSSFDVELARRVGAAMGREVRAAGVDVLLAPGVNIKRTPLCGRNFEYLSEDPHHAGRMGAAVVDGVQSAGVGASLKHYAVNNQETDRHRVSADVTERALREIYLAAFEHVITTSDPWTVMCAYNRINGVPASQHAWLLTTVLRDEWAYEGVVISDWGAVVDRVEAVRAGLDVEMPTSGPQWQADLDVVAAVNDGRLPEALVGRAAERVLTLVQRATDARAATPIGKVPIDEDGQHALAREFAAQCPVLLKNDGTLPLNVAASIAVIGELARTPRLQGGGSSRVNPTRVDVPLDEIERLATGPVAFAAGYDDDGRVEDPELIVDAVEVASTADVVVLFVGLSDSEESEGFDRAHLDLPRGQLALLEAIAATGTPIAVVLVNGGVVSVSGWESQASAILESWLLGQAGGGAIADLLFGVVNPSGRLAETIPLKLADTPAATNFPGEGGRVSYGEGIFVGYRWYDARDLPVSYPFGHGLSYTTFGYSDLDVQTTGTGRALAIDVTATISNTGAREGREVVQLYLAPAGGDVARPLRELRGFAKLALAPGESRPVVFRLGWRDLAYWSVATASWEVDPGELRIELGASSRDIRLSGMVALPIPDRTIVLGPDSTLSEWAGSSHGRAVLEDALSSDVPRSLLSAQALETLGSFPLSRLAKFSFAGLDPARLTELAETANHAIA
jgi:beta-glucosidase